MKTDSLDKVKDDLGGGLSVKFKTGKTFDELCTAYIENYNPDRFEAIALRCYYGKEAMLTLFAIDKDRMEGDNYDKEKMPVKKFKLSITILQNFLPFIEEFNFTVSTGNYPIEDILVMNK